MTDGAASVSSPKMSGASSPSFVELVTYLEDFAFDGELYVVLPSITGTSRFELRWERGGGLWLRPEGSGPWEPASAAELERVLLRRGVDLVVAEQQLTQAAMNQVVFAELVRNRAEALFGAAAVRDALADNGRFLNQLRELVLRDGTSPREPSGFAPAPRHLRLVSND